MPEAEAAPAAALRELILVERAERLPAGVPWVAFGEAAAGPEAPLDLGDVFRPQRARLRAAFVEWLGRLNAANASLAWWVHATTAKNLLSSRFGDQVFELLGLRLLLDSGRYARLGVVGASAAQAETLARLAMHDSQRLRIVRDHQADGRPLFAVTRALYQFLRTLCAWAWWLRRMRSPNRPAVHVLTYADRGFRDGDDAFFGALAGWLAKREPSMECQYHAFIHGSYCRVVPLLRRTDRSRYAPLFAELSFADQCGALRQTLAALARVAQWPRPDPLQGLDLEPVLRDALRGDIAGGGYFHNLLVHRAARRLGQRLRPAVFLYPYENKSLEKLLLLGLREAPCGGRIVGYQHTSVTPRHATLLFGPGEAERTPLPDRIATAGAVTLAYLEAHGRYPRGLLVEACALRQPPRPLLERRVTAGSTRVMFALSSSVAELRAALRLLLEAAELRGEWQFAIRPHPEFPVARLPAELRSAVGTRVLDFSATPLDENLAWADVVAYASSTVGLEALMAGRAVINVDFGEPLEADPVLEPVPLHRRVRSAAELVEAVDAIESLDEADFAARRSASRNFIERYFREVSAQRLEALIGQAR